MMCLSKVITKSVSGFQGEGHKGDTYKERVAASGAQLKTTAQGLSAL